MTPARWASVLRDRLTRNPDIRPESHPREPARECARKRPYTPSDGMSRLWGRGGNILDGDRAPLQRALKIGGPVDAATDPATTGAASAARRSRSATPTPPTPRPSSSFAPAARSRTASGAAAKAAGLTGGHSQRVGFAHNRAGSGASTTELMMVGRWDLVSESRPQHPRASRRLGRRRPLLRGPPGVKGSRNRPDISSHGSVRTLRNMGGSGRHARARAQHDRENAGGPLKSGPDMRGGPANGPPVTPCPVVSSVSGGPVAQ